MIDFHVWRLDSHSLCSSCHCPGSRLTGLSVNGTSWSSKSIIPLPDPEPIIVEPSNLVQLSQDTSLAIWELGIAVPVKFHMTLDRYHMTQS